MHASETETSQIVRDPVCGMTVDPAAGKPDVRPRRAHAFTSAATAAATASPPRPDDFVDRHDPVCGMAVDRATAAHMARHDGRRFYFCSAGCRSRFEADPAAFLGAGRRPGACRPGTVWTCPMHPEIRRTTPATARSAAWRSSPPASPPTRRTPSSPISAAASPSARALTVPLLVIAMGPMLGLPLALPRAGSKPCSPPRSSSGAAGRSSCAAPAPSRAAASTCSA